jgi:ABC-type uncharacterized transport system involved in gliding motility auxiliary subunit
MSTQGKTSKRRASNLADSTVFVVIVIAIVVAVNVILSLPAARRARVDLTRDSLHTLSGSSKELVRGIEGELLIKFFISEDLQYPDHTLEQQVRDLLEEYEVAGDGKVRFEIIHPDEEDEPALEVGPDGQPIEKELTPEEERVAEEGPRGFGIQKVPVGVRGRDEVVLRNVYKGMALIYGDDVEVINELKSTDNLEYELTKRIKTLVTPETARHRVGFVKGFGGPADTPQFLESLNGAFDQIYGDLVKAVAVDLHDPQVLKDLMVSCQGLDVTACEANKMCRVPASVKAAQERGEAIQGQVCYPEVDALVILNAQDEFTPSAKFALDQFLMRGHGIAWMQTTSKPNEQMPMLPTRQPVMTGLEELVGAWGLKLESDMVLDRRNNIVSLILTEQGVAQLSNPSMPQTSDINAESVITRDVPFMAFPLVSSITVAPGIEGDPELQLTRLVSSEAESVRLARVGPLDFEQLQKPQEGEEPGPFLVAAALQGRIKSFWHDKEKPASEPSSNPSDPPLSFPDPIKRSESGARVVVVGSGEFMFPNRQNGFSNQFSGIGALFMLNIIDWLVQDEGLVSIRAKGIPAVIKDVEPEDYTLWQFLNIAGVPTIFALFGLVAWALRRKRQRELTL